MRLNDEGLLIVHVARLMLSPDRVRWSRGTWFAWFVVADPFAAHHPKDFAMRYSLSSTIVQDSTTCLTDTEAPRRLGVALAKFGDLAVFFPKPTGSHSPVRVADPLVLALTNVEPGCRLEILNLSKNPAAEWSNAADVRAMPGNALKALGDGRYGVVMGNASAQKIGVSPGDVFEI